MAERTKEIELYTGMKEVMEYLTKEDILFGVISSNSQQIIESTFKQYGLKEPIFIGTSSAIFKKHTIYKKFCSKHKLTVKKSLYIGDETRDIELGNKLDIPVLSVSWGFNTEATLKEAGASNLIQNPIDLIPLITQFMQTGKATAIA
jgi:phosphoglycolate phosphatase